MNNLKKLLAGFMSALLLLGCLTISAEAEGDIANNSTITIAYELGEGAQFAYNYSPTYEVTSKEGNITIYDKEAVVKNGFVLDKWIVKDSSPVTEFIPGNSYPADSFTRNITLQASFISNQETNNNEEQSQQENQSSNDTETSDITRENTQIQITSSGENQLAITVSGAFSPDLNGESWECKISGRSGDARFPLESDKWMQTASGYQFTVDAEYLNNYIGSMNDGSYSAQVYLTKDNAENAFGDPVTFQFRSTRKTFPHSGVAIKTGADGISLIADKSNTEAVSYVEAFYTNLDGQLGGNKSSVNLWSQNRNQGYNFPIFDTNGSYDKSGFAINDTNDIYSVLLKADYLKQHGITDGSYQINITVKDYKDYHTNGSINLEFPSTISSY